MGIARWGGRRPCRSTPRALYPEPVDNLPALVISGLSLLVALNALVFSIRTYRRAGARVVLETPIWARNDWRSERPSSYVTGVELINTGLAGIQVVRAEWVTADPRRSRAEAAAYLKSTSKRIKFPAQLTGLGTLEISVLGPSFEPQLTWGDEIGLLIERLIPWLKGRLVPPPRPGAKPTRHARLVFTMGNRARVRSRVFELQTDWSPGYEPDPWPEIDHGNPLLVCR